ASVVGGQAVKSLPGASRNTTPEGLPPKLPPDQQRADQLRPARSLLLDQGARRPLLHRLFDEAVAVQPLPLQGDEEPPRLDGPAVGRDPHGPGPGAAGQEAAAHHLGDLRRGPLKHGPQTSTRATLGAPPPGRRRGRSGRRRSGRSHAPSLRSPLDPLPSLRRWPAGWPPAGRATLGTWPRRPPAAPPGPPPPPPGRWPEGLRSGGCRR